MNFSQWWDINHTEYEKIGVNKIIAKSIWNAACDSLETLLTNELLKHANNSIK